ncbi:metal-dependent hydrolase family protein [Catellatospora chokoriensis]|uniref:metal-dependent hydrolase family protein n=1 Tax=Catellatospora chokoriensis TaxID=310353 RepID=UPI001781A083|nr:amidohydrolase family protein [Catellatospora chokoriensis]
MARDQATEVTEFRDVRVFDGVGPTLSPPTTVTVTGSLITRVGARAEAGATPARTGDDPAGGTIEPSGAADRPPGGQRAVTIVDGGGRVLMPGLIDAHWHAMMAAVSLPVLATADPGYLQLIAGREAERTLLRGFTTVRDAGGPVFALKRAIDEGIVTGPRIYPSGAFISQTAGHGDFRSLLEVPREPGAPLTMVERTGTAAIADGVDAVLRATREQLMRGASQIKVMAGGGVASPYDPIDVTQYTFAELAAAVEAAGHWGTYVMVHAYTPASVQQAVRAGVRCVEHGHLLDDETAALMAERGVWWSMQPFLDDSDAIPIPDPAGRAKQLAVTDGTETAYRLAREHGVRLAWGTDTLFDAGLATRQGAQLAKLGRWFSPAEVLRMATSENAALLAMSGPRDPYPAPLGVVRAGAYADLLLVDGDPLADLAVLADPGNLRVIMKDGVPVRNTLP